MMLALVTTLCIATVDPHQDGNMTVVYMQRFEPCPVVERVKFADPPHYPSAAQCKINPKLERCG